MAWSEGQTEKRRETEGDTREGVKERERDRERKEERKEPDFNGRCKHHRSQFPVSHKLRISGNK